MKARRTTTFFLHGLIVLLWILLCVAQRAEPLPYQQANSATEESWLAQAKQAEAAHDFRRAAELYSRYVEKHPDRPEVLQRLGLVFYLSNEFDRAVPALEQALRLDKTLWGSALFLGISYYRTGQFEKAIEPLKAVLGLKPNLEEANFWLGSTFLAMGRADEAIFHLGRISPNSRLSLEADSLLAKAYRRAAENSYQRIQKLDPDSFRLHELQAESLAWKNNASKAIVEYREALRRKRDLEGAHRAIGDLYWRQGWSDLARKEYEDELRFAPLDDLAHLRLGQYWLVKGDTDRAIEHLEVATRIDKDSPEAYQTFGQVWLVRGDYSKAESSLKVAIQRAPALPLSHQLLAEVYRRTGRSGLAKAETELFEKLSSKKENVPAEVRTEYNEPRL